MVLVLIWLPASKPNSDEPPEVELRGVEGGSLSALGQEKVTDAQSKESDV
jgi:hypothetical protein